MAGNNGWQQHRTPAFGDWNYIYPRDDDGAGVGVDDWPPVSVTPFFDFASATRTADRPAPVAEQKSTKRSSSMPKARRMRIPAFGEWNHHGDGSSNDNGIGNGTWPAVMTTPFFDLATQQTGRRRRGGDDRFDASSKLQATAAAAEATQGHVQKRRSKVADSGAYAAAAKRSCFTVAKPVDDDLYVVPPDMMLYGKPPPAPRRQKNGLGLRILRLLGCSCCLSAS